MLPRWRECRLFATALVAGCSTSPAAAHTDAAVARDVGHDGGHDGGRDGGRDGAHDTAGAEASDTTPRDGALDARVADVVTVDVTRIDAAPARSSIEHVVIIVQENHTFDTYFGRYCTAAAGSSPTCTTGPSCCEAAPATDPSGASPVVLDDTQNASYRPDNSSACETSEIDDGKMDGFVTGTSCSAPGNFAIAPAALMQTYHGYAGSYALADRYFQPAIGSSSSNDMYLAVAKYVFQDNMMEPQGIGDNCSIGFQTIYTGQTTVLDLVLAAGYSARYYAEGYAAAKQAAPACPAPPPGCLAAIAFDPCDFTPGNVPFDYYSQFNDNPSFMTDLGDFLPDLARGGLPSVSFVKLLDYKSEHPGLKDLISVGVTQIDELVQGVLASPYAESTLILLTWDEGGGFFDHVAPPPSSAVDQQPYGTRIPLLAIGPFAMKNTISHVVMEHSSIVKFLEWNYTGSTGQLLARDAVVNNIGSLLDPTTTGTTVPSN